MVCVCNRSTNVNHSPTKTQSYRNSLMRENVSGTDLLKCDRFTGIRGKNGCKRKQSDEEGRGHLADTSPADTKE